MVKTRSQRLGAVTITDVSVMDEVMDEVDDTIDDVLEEVAEAFEHEYREAVKSLGLVGETKTLRDATEAEIDHNKKQVVLKVKDEIANEPHPRDDDKEWGGEATVRDLLFAFEHGTSPAGKGGTIRGDDPGSRRNPGQRTELSVMKKTLQAVNDVVTESMAEEIADAFTEAQTLTRFRGLGVEGGGGTHVDARD